MDNTKSGWKFFPDAALVTDFYELSMAEAYFREGIGGEAVFDIAIRNSPKRGYYVACGMNAAAEAASCFGFSEEQIAYLSSLGFGDDFLGSIAKSKARASIESVREGEVVFPGEPVLKVKAPLGMAQMLETSLLNIVGFQTMIATKASRVCLAAAGRNVVEFGLRRAQGFDAGLWSAYASYVGGCGGTSNLLAGKEFGLPVSGTVGHSYIMAHAGEEDAFGKWAQYAKSPVFLIDTYDTLEGAHRAARVAKKIKSAGKSLAAVRIDSKDSARESAAVRKILDAEGLAGTKIIISGGMDEFEIGRFFKDGGVADSFGVGTNMVVSNDMPSLDISYKLAQIGGKPVMKRTAGKESMPGNKQVFRESKAGKFVSDTVGLHGEEFEGMEKLLVERGGKGRIDWKTSARKSREYAAARLACAPNGIKSLENPDEYPVIKSAMLKTLIKDGKH